MTSARTIQTYAKKLLRGSLNNEGKLDSTFVEAILQAIVANDTSLFDIKVESIQRVSLLKAYLILVKNKAIEDSIIITTAIPLPQLEYNERLQEMIRASDKKQVYFTHDANILGGIKIQFGWNILDASVQHKLDILTT